MSEVAEPVAIASPAEKKVKKAAAAKKPKAKANHPPCSEMVDSAIAALKERGGSSVLAIKKYIVATYKADVEKLAPFIKKYVKGAVVKGHLLQTKGKGASGSFKLSTKAAPAKKASKPKADKPKKAVAAKPKSAKKPAGAKKPAAAKKAVAKKPVAAKKAAKAKVAAVKKSPAKAKPAAKPKAAAKPKKVAAKAKKPATSVKKPIAKKVSAKK